MNSPANLSPQRQFLEEIATHYSFTGDRRTVFLSRFDPVNLTKDNTVLVGVIDWNKEYEDKAQKLQDELNNICQVLKEDGCLIDKPKRGRQPKGKSPWEQAFKWLWDKFPEWQQKQIVKVPSEQVQKTALSLFLKNIEDKSNELYLLHRRDKPIVLKDQYVSIQVTLERRYNHLVESIWSYSESETELKRVYALKGLEDKPTQIDWAEAKQQHQRIMVLADPGMGKSTLLKMEASLIAQEAWNSLANNLTSIEDVTLPLLIRLSELAGATKEPEAKVIEAIPKLIEARCKNFEEIKLVLEYKLQKGQCILLLDALDEVPSEQRNRLSEKLNYFLDHHPCQIICTSRIVGYGGGFMDGGKDVEIVPFSQPQTEQYIETWFNNAAGYLSDETVSASELIQELRNKTQVGGLAQNPLLLSLICSLYQEKGLILPARRCQVYEKAVDYMLDKWSQNRKPKPQGRILAKTRLLEELAYRFSCEGKEIFFSDELYDQLEEYLQRERVPTVFKNADTSELMAELSEEDGILQKLSREGDKYLFLHRTFQEYFTASYLQRNRDCVALAKEHFWEYDWHETLGLLAGLMDKPILLIRAITDEKDDIFSTLLLLAGRCVAECRDISDDLVVEIIDRIYGFWHSYPDEDFTKLSVVALGQANSQMFQKLHTALNHSDGGVRYQAAEALGKIGNAQAIEALITALNHSDEEVRWMAAEALGKIGNAQAVAALITALKDSDDDVRWEAAEALGEIGNAQAVAALIATLNHSDDDVRLCAKETLAEIDNRQAAPALIAAFNDLDPQVRLFVGMTLNEIGNPQAVEALMVPTLNALYEFARSQAAEDLRKSSNPQPLEALITALNDSNLLLRILAVWTLSDIDNFQAVEALIAAALNDSDSISDNIVRIQAVVALKKMGNPQVVEALITALNHSESSVTWQAAEALGEIGNPQAVAALTIALNHSDKFVRFCAARALAKIGNSQTVAAFTTALNDSDELVRRWAALALAKIGTSETLAKLIQLPEIDIYDSDIFPLARKLAIRFSRDKLPFIPVYPELVAHKL